jgi:splicing factor 1
MPKRRSAWSLGFARFLSFKAFVIPNSFSLFNSSTKVNSGDMWRPSTRNVSGTNEVCSCIGCVDLIATRAVQRILTISQMPLGNKRRFGGEDGPPSDSSSYSRHTPSDADFHRRDADRGRDDYRRDDDRRKDDRRYEREGDRDGGRRERRWDDDRGRDTKSSDAPPPPPPPEGKHFPPPSQLTNVDFALDGPRKRRSRWGDASEKVDVSGLPVSITGKVSQTELDNYAIHVRLEEINKKLRLNDVVPPDHQRSPSPPPAYDAYGRRTNTRELRYRKKLEEERTRLVDRAMKNDPNFRVPMEAGSTMNNMRRGARYQDKVYIPVKEFPEINFFGLLVGPRGNSLKNMERESGAKISIRGKGSVKEGKGRSDAFAGDEDDELHALVTGDEEYKVKACVALINKVIETAASTPEGQNDHKRNQLRELASLNGTLRDDENQLCQNCGEKGHRRWECPQARVYSANVICRLCGGAGHMARDCRGRGDPNLAKSNQTQFDSEYSALMAELGEGANSASAPQGAQPQEQRLPPWRIPENWMSSKLPLAVLVVD